MSFAADTAVVGRGGGRYGCDLSPAWWVQRGPNGGYLAAIVLRAIVSEVAVTVVAGPARHPRSLTVHYLEPPAAGPAEVVVTVERSGRRLTTCSARMEQDGRLKLLALAAVSDGWPSAFDYDDVARPDVNPPDECVVPARPDGTAPSVLANFEQRLALGGMAFSGHHEAVSGGWLRAVPNRAPDAMLVACFTDAWLPAPMARATALVGAPTIDLTIHFRRPLPRPGATDGDWTLLVMRSRLSADGFFEEDGEVWSEDGTLLAQSRQLALLLPVSPPS